MKKNLGKPHIAKVGLCTVNNDPLDFQKNCSRIMKSIELCKSKNCKMRLGPELELSGYACNDHFNQFDTVSHSWTMIARILESKLTQDIFCSIGMPIIHHGALYNAHTILYNNRVIAVRPKLFLADGDNYFQSKWFIPWKARRQIGQFQLPESIQQLTGDSHCPIGEFVVQFQDTSLGYEICQESWISKNPGIDMVNDGAQIIVNPSASCIERRKLRRKIQMLRELSDRLCACFCYLNLKGGIGERTYFDGGCIAAQCGNIISVSELNTIEDVQVTQSYINITAIRAARLATKSFGKQSIGVNLIPRVKIDLKVANCQQKYKIECPKTQLKLQRILTDYHTLHATWEPSLFLWDYLRKSQANGFFLPLSGGLDSCSVALIVYNMCFLVYKEIKERSNLQVLADLRKMVGSAEYEPTSPEQICHYLLFCAYLATENSSNETKQRAQKIAKTLNANFRFVSFDPIYEACQQLGQQSIGIKMQFQKNGGTWRQDLALQNIQARSRMMLSYMYAQMQLEAAKRSGFLLVLGAGNLCEALRGYFTKYDNSSADINPIGTFSKKRLREILQWNKDIHKFEFIDEVINASPTAELRPLIEGQIAQTDQEQMGLSYSELHTFGQLRRIHKLGPVSMFQVLYESEGYDNIKELAQRVKKFFKYYGINRHKMTVMTPSFHYDLGCCDDNRYDMRPIIYATDWSYQFKVIDERVLSILASESNEQQN